MDTHPEQRPNEVYIGNHVGEIQPYLSRLRTLRLGNVPYDIDGNLIDNEKEGQNYRPMFITKEEEPAFDRIMDEVGRRINRGENYEKIKQTVL